MRAARMILPISIVLRAHMMAFICDRLWPTIYPIGYGCNHSRSDMTYLRAHYSAQWRRVHRGGPGAAVDVAIHKPRPGADRRNHHAHLFTINAL